MRKRIRRETMAEDLAIAIGLIWGHLKTFQYEEAYKLARGCLRIWPQEHRLIVMAAFASVELLVPLDAATQEALQSPECRTWAELIRQRTTADIDQSIAVAAQQGNA